MAMTSEYPYRVGAVAYILNNKGQLLLVQLINYGANEWNIPGGGRDDGESAEQNILRELKEELFIEPNDLKLIGRPIKPLKYEFPPELANERKQRGQIKDQFVFKYLLEQPKLAYDKSEIKAAMWCDLDKLSYYLLFPGQLQTVTDTLAESGIL